MTADRIKWDFNYRIGVESASKLKNTVLSRRGSYLNIQLFQSGMFGSTNKGQVNIDLKDLSSKCTV